jgi:hypothetical protein
VATTSPNRTARILDGCDGGYARPPAHTKNRSTASIRKYTKNTITANYNSIDVKPPCTNGLSTYTQSKYTRYTPSHGLIPYFQTPTPIASILLHEFVEFIFFLKKEKI